MIEVGSRRSDTERFVEAAIVQVQVWKGRRLSYQPVSGGNTNFRVTVAHDPVGYFVKIPGRGTEIDRGAARAASRQADDAGPTFDFLDHLNIEVSEFLDDRRPSTHRDFVDPAFRANVVQINGRFHEAPPLPLTKTVFDMIEEHYEQVRQLGGFWPEDMPGSTASISRHVQRSRRPGSISFPASTIPCPAASSAGTRAPSFTRHWPTSSGAPGRWCRTGSRRWISISTNTASGNTCGARSIIRDPRWPLFLKAL